MKRAFTALAFMTGAISFGHAQSPSLLPQGPAGQHDAGQHEHHAPDAIGTGLAY